MPPKIVVNHPYNRVMFSCETYALDNKAIVYTQRQARTQPLHRRPSIPLFTAFQKLMVPEPGL